MPPIDVELRQGTAYSSVLGVIQTAMDAHRVSEGCTFARKPEEIADEVFDFLVSKVEGAEQSCPLHAGGRSVVGFT